MAGAHNRLSARFIATVTEAGRYADGGNLYLSVSSNGGRRWVFMYRWKGKQTEMGLGSAREVTLAKARERAASARAQLADGLNPLEAREQKLAIPTFGQAADELIGSMEASWRNPKHRAQWRMTLTEYAGPIRGKTVDSITTEDILTVLRPIWQSKPETASRVRGRIEAVLDAAKAQGHRQGENPARWRGHLDCLLPARKRLSRGHHAAMPYADVPAFVATLQETATTSNLALEFTILAAARTGEVLGATWGEISFEERLWRVPPARMKSSRPHQVPLTSRMLEILEQAKPQDCDTAAFVFPGTKEGKSLSVMALTMALRRNKAGQFTVHGFRSSFRDWTGDETDFSRDVAEAALAHVIRDATEAAYRRSSALEKRRELMTAWTDYLQSKTGANIIPLQMARRA